MKPANLWECAARKGGTPAEVMKRELSALKRRAVAAERRTFPEDAGSLKSTEAYVQAFYASNHLLHVTGRKGVEGLFPNLNKAPTTWPPGDDIVTEVVDAPEEESLV